MERFLWNLEDHRVYRQVFFGRNQMAGLQTVEKRKEPPTGLDWDGRAKMFFTLVSLPLDQVFDKLGDLRTGDIRF